MAASDFKKSPRYLPEFDKWCRLLSNSSKEVEKMKIVSLCESGGCCPVVKLSDEQVEIGENDNTCILSKAEWEVLKKKILNREI